MRDFVKMAGLACALALTADAANAATCGNTAAGFEAWKAQMANEARGKAGPAALAALAGTTYASGTIAADRNQSGFRLSFEQFMAKRGGSTIAARGRTMKSQPMFASIERTYGVPPGPLLAIWGMETGFGAVKGKQNVLSAIATLAYDCRRSAFFTDQLYADLGDRFERLGDATTAERARTSVLDLLPNDAEGHQKLAEIREKQAARRRRLFRLNKRGKS